MQHGHTKTSLSEEASQRDQCQGSQAPGTFANIQESQMYQLLLSWSNKATTKAQSLGYLRLPAHMVELILSHRETADHRVSDPSPIPADFHERSGGILRCP